MGFDTACSQRPEFDLVTLCPPMMYGPTARDSPGPADLYECNARIYNHFFNSSRTAELPPNAQESRTQLIPGTAQRICAPQDPQDDVRTRLHRPIHMGEGYRTP